MKNTITTRVREVLARRGIGAMSAESLHETLKAAEAERDTLVARQREASEARVELLMTGDDAEIDALETELAAIARTLDRHEVRIPELKRRWHDAYAAETAAVDRRDYDAAVTAHVATARKIDTAIAALGPLFEEFEASGAELRRLSHFHPGERADPVAGRGAPDRDAVAMAIVSLAPKFAEALKIEVYGGQKPARFHDHVSSFWDRVTAAVQRAQAPKVETPPPLPDRYGVSERMGQDRSVAAPALSRYSA